MTRTRKHATQHQLGAAALFSCLSIGRPSVMHWYDEQLNKGGSPP